MKTLRLSGVFLALGFLACSDNVGLPAGESLPLQITAQVDNAKPATNDTILYTVTVDKDERLAVEIPQFGANIAGLRVTDAGQGPTRQAAGRQITSYWYKMRADISGVYLLPAVEIPYARPEWYQNDGNTEELLTAKTAEIFLEVDSRIADGGSLVLRELKPLPRVQSEIPWLWIIIAVVVLFAVCGVWFMRRRQREEVTVIRPAHEIAYDGLAALVDIALSDEAAQRNFFFRLSAVLREYLENRFGINATDMTTEEVSRVLLNITELDDPHKRASLNMLRSYDRVKYAGLLLERENGNTDVSEVKRFVDDTREVTADSGVEEG